MSAGPVEVVAGMLAWWSTLRAELAEIERTEHPDVTDRFGRAWTWRSGDLYIHDELLTFPLELIDSLGLPSEGLADRNPNYAGLCDTCQHKAGTARIEEPVSVAACEEPPRLGAASATLLDLNPQAVTA